MVPARDSAPTALVRLLDAAARNRARTGSGWTAPCSDRRDVAAGPARGRAVEINGASADLDPSRIYRSVDELLASTPVDFAVVALPTALHEQASVALAHEGIHLLVEKPLALSAHGAAAIISACNEADVHGAVAHVERYNAALIELKRLLAGGDIGKPLAIVSERSGPFPARVRSGGVISDLATHDLDLIPWLADERIELVFAQTSSPPGSEREHLAAITGRLASGVVFNTVADWLSPVRTRRVRVVGGGRNARCRSARPEPEPRRDRARRHSACSIGAARDPIRVLLLTPRRSARRVGRFPRRGAPRRRERRCRRAKGGRSLSRT
jgi:predicted dehydrogenase